MKWTLLIAAVFGFLSVALGAFGAHALQDVLDTKSLMIFETAVKYQFYHAITLLAVSFYNLERGHKLLLWASGFFIFGIVVFSGSLYALVFTGIRKFGMITPIGGLSLLIGWGILVVYGYHAARNK